MTAAAPRRAVATAGEPVVRPRARHYLMCPPTHFTVAYAINARMDVSVPVDRARAQAQWDAVRGHVRGARSPRRPAGPAPGTAGHGLRRKRRDDGRWPRLRGPFVLGSRVLAGTGFRTEPAAHREAREHLGAPVVSLDLVDPRFYHLDTALFALDQHNIAYYPPAFSTASRGVLAREFPDAVLADDTDAAALGLNAVSDGHNVVLPVEAWGLAERLGRRGYAPVPVDVSELRKGGGGPKCCTLEVRA